MIASSRRNRQKIAERSAATRLHRSLHRGRALATHAIAAGVTEPKTVEGVKAGLLSAAKRIGVKPVKVVRSHRTVQGTQARTQTTYHFTTAQVARLLRAYNPRKKEYQAAVITMIAAQGPKVTVRQSVRSVKSRELATV